MQVMTPEQEEQWRTAINPLDYLDFHALSETGLRASARRLRKDNSAPGWAIMGRRYCIVQAWEEGKSWVPQFALRSEVAMAGLALLYPQWDARALLYRRLLLDFLYLALAPFAENLEPLDGVRDLCLLSSTEEQTWKERQLLLRRVHSAYKRSLDLYCLHVADRCIGILRRILFPPPEKWWKDSGLYLVDHLAWLYKQRTEYGSFARSKRASLREQNPYHPVANAFLAALEAKCPPPDWLTRQ